jgi:hypothetical protein
MANVTVTIRTVDDQLVPALVDGVTVDVFDSTGLVFLASGVTGAVTPGNGEVQFSLPGGVDYVARLYKAGVSFLPAPQKQFAATEPPAGPDFNFFQYECHVGLIGALVQIVVSDDTTPTPVPVEGAVVRLFSSPADAFLTEFVTDTNGEIDPVLEGDVTPGKEYIVRVLPPVGYSAGPTETISVIDPLAVGETNIFDLTVFAPSALPASTDPDMCRLSGYFGDPSLRPLKNLSLIFHPREGYPKFVVSGSPFGGQPSVVRNRVIASERRVNTDKNGYIEIDLPRTGIFDVYVQGLDAPDHTLLAPIYVPDVAGIAIHELLYPYVTKVTYAAPAVTVPVGEQVELELALETSNVQPVTSYQELQGLLVFTIGDLTLASVGVTPEGKLLISGIAAGATTLEVTRVVGTYAPRRPEVADLIILPSIPTITVV